MSPLHDTKPLLIADGYNILRSSKTYEDFFNSLDYFDDAISPAREKVISDVAAFAVGKFEAVVVFDGGGNVNSDGKPIMVAGVKVIFSPKGKDADTVIERLVYEAKENGREVVVISSDWAVQNATFTDGIIRMSSAGFGQELATIDDDIEEISTSNSKMTLGSRIDSKTRAALEALARNASFGGHKDEKSC